jgi:hypothetical protein
MTGQPTRFVSVRTNTDLQVDGSPRVENGNRMRIDVNDAWPDYESPRPLSFLRVAFVLRCLVA